MIGAGSGPHRPGATGRGPWLAVVAVLFAGPLVLGSGFGLALLSQFATLAVFALSYNLLYGRTGLLSFGHAVYSGLGAFAAIHAMRAAAGDGPALPLPLPLPLVPLAGGLAAAAAAAILAGLTRRRGGTAFAMITLGVGELVHAAALVLPEVFGGEGGVSADRSAGARLPGLDFGAPIAAYGLIAVWCLGAMVAMRAIASTPLGHLAEAVREHPERLAFVGADPAAVRYRMQVVAAFFAGVSGGLAAIQLEVVTADHLSAARSGSVLLAVFVGGAAGFFGPVVGAATFTLFAAVLSEWTRAWQLYFGVLFLLTVRCAPGGLASVAGPLVGTLAGAVRAGPSFRLHRLRAALGAAAALAAAGAVAAVELGYRATLGAAVFSGPVLPRSTAALAWALALGALVVGLAASVALRRRLARQAFGDPPSSGQGDR